MAVRPPKQLGNVPDASGKSRRNDETINNDKYRHLSVKAIMSSDFSDQTNCLPKQRGFKITFLNIVSIPKKIFLAKLD